MNIQPIGTSHPPRTSQEKSPLQPKEAKRMEDCAALTGSGNTNKKYSDSPFTRERP